MKKALLVGSSYSSIPILKILKKIPLELSVCGYLKSDPCHLYADKSFYIDYSDKYALLKLCKKEKFDYIIPCCNDTSYLSCSYVANELNIGYGFDKYDISQLIHSKKKFQEYTQSKKFPSPLKIDKELLERDDIKKIKFPILVKPDKSFSGKGITKLTNSDNLKEAISFASKNSENKKFIIEEFVEGSLHSLSAFISKGKILTSYFVDEFCSVYSYQVDSSYLSTSLTQKIKKEVIENIQKFISELNLLDGLIHTQFIANKDKFSIIEITRRAPGDLYGTLIEKTTTYNYWKFYTYPFINKEIVLGKDCPPKYITRYTITSNKNIFMQSFDYKLTAKQITVIPLKSSGYSCKKAPFDKIAIIFVEFNNKQQMIENTVKMTKLINIETI